MTSVEYEPVIKDIAERWFGYRNVPNHAVFVDDGFRFVEEYDEAAGLLLFHQK